MCGVAFCTVFSSEILYSELPPNPLVTKSLSFFVANLVANRLEKVSFYSKTHPKSATMPFSNDRNKPSEIVASIHSQTPENHGITTKKPPAFQLMALVRVARVELTAS